MKTSRLATALLLLCSVSAVGQVQTATEKAEPNRIAQASDDGILIGGISGMMYIRLGMARKLIREKLTDRYELVSTDNGDTLLVVDKTNPGSKPIGAISFEDDRVVVVNKFWGSFERSDAASLATTLYSVLNGLNKEGKTIARIETKQTVDPQFTQTETKMIFGSKTVAVISLKSKLGTDATNVIEVLRSK